MIICICEGVNDKTIAREITRGACSVRSIQRRCGAGTGCGQCVVDLQQMLRDGPPEVPEACAPPEVKLAS